MPVPRNRAYFADGAGGGEKPSGNGQKKKDMEKKEYNPWLRCAAVFVVSLAVIIAMHRLVPTDDPEGSNLLVNGFMALCITAGFAVADRRWRKNRRHREEIQRRLNEK